MKAPSFVSSRLLQLAAVLLVSLQLPPTACIAATLRVPQDYPDITAASKVAVGGDSILVWPPNGGGDWTFQLAILRQGVTIRGMVPPPSRVTILNSDVHLLDGAVNRSLDDTTRVENLKIVTPPLYESVQVYSARSSIKECFLGAAPNGYSVVRMWQGGSIIGNTFEAGSSEASFGLAAKQGTLVIAWNYFSGRRGFILYNTNAPQPAELSFRNNTLVSCLNEGVALGLRQDSDAEIVNCIFQDVSTLLCVGDGTVSVRHNDIWPYTQIKCVLGNGNIAANPLLCSRPPELIATWIAPTSPCVGTGEGGVNIGAGGVCEVAAVIPDAGISEPRLTLEVSPNPVGSRTEFRISGTWNPTTIEIYDTAGRVVDIIQAAELPFAWEPSSSIRPGVYFVRMRAKEGSTTRKIVLLPR